MIKVTVHSLLVNVDFLKEMTKITGLLILHLKAGRYKITILYKIFQTEMVNYRFCQWDSTALKNLQIYLSILFITQ